MKQPLKQQVKQQFEKIELNTQQLRTLEALTNSEEQTFNVSKHFFNSKLLPATVFIIAITAVFTLLQWQTTSNKNIPELIAKEVVKNHLKLKPMEVKADTINSIKGYFSKLEFMPVDSRIVNQQDMQLLGGRYCSLQGITAAQFRMKHGQHTETLYQTQYLPEVFGAIPQLDKGEEPLAVFAKGIKVVIWVEKDLLLAITETSN